MESRDLRTIDTLKGQISAKIPRLHFAALGMTHIERYLYMDIRPPTVKNNA